MLWWACNLFAALVVVCVFLFGREGSGKWALWERARVPRLFGDVACMYDEARGTWLIRSERFHR
jgi:hypothetical protein